MPSDLPARIGRYEVELELGHGELGRVFLARDPGLRRQVAVKVLRDDLDLPVERRAQIEDCIREQAYGAASLAHPGIVPLHDMGEDERLGPFLVYELVTGLSLRERLQRGSLPPAEGAQLARSRGAALHHGHAKGVVHRDVKPENVLIPRSLDSGGAGGGSGSGSGSAKLTDFGGFGDFRGFGEHPGFGDPAYSAPEVIASGAFSTYSDQFSLAATLFEALTGLPAFSGPDRASVALRVATSKQAPPTSLRPTLEAFAHVDPIFDRALAKEPRNRFPSCESFVSLLTTELEGASTRLLVEPAPRSSIVPRATRRWQNVAALTGFAVILSLVIAGRYHQSSGAQGVSLKGVASAFHAAVAAGATRHAAPSSAATHHPNPTHAMTSTETAVTHPETEDVDLLGPGPQKTNLGPNLGPTQSVSRGLDSGIPTTAPSDSNAVGLDSPPP
jgi:serine/threonine-protein kinase